MRKRNINEFNPVKIGWNCYNGLIISIFHFDLNKPNIDSSLFGLNISSNFIYLDILYITIKIFNKK